MKVVWSPLAVERAYEEARFIAEDKPHAALRWLGGLFQSTDRLVRFPDLGRVLLEISLPECREITEGSHRMIYRLEKNVVSILTSVVRANSSRSPNCCPNPRKEQQRDNEGQVFEFRLPVRNNNKRRGTTRDRSSNFAIGDRRRARR